MPTHSCPGSSRICPTGATLWVLLLVHVLTGCVSQGTSEADRNRSMKQYELAIGLRGEGNDPGAFQALFKAIEVDPDNAKAHLLLENMFLVGREDNPGNDELVIKHFQEVLRIQASESAHPEQTLASDARNGLGVLYLHQKRYDLAITEFQHAVEDLFNRRAYMAWGNLGRAYYETAAYDKAEEALMRAVKQEPRFCVGYFHLGRTYVKVEQFEKADHALTQALEADERCKIFQDAWHLRGETRMKLGQRDDARADFERCVELGSRNEAGAACTRYLEATY